MSLYVFRPRGYGANTYSVLENSKDAALERIKEFLEQNPGQSITIEDLESTFYDLEIYEFGQVAINQNA